MRRYGKSPAWISSASSPTAAGRSSAISRTRSRGGAAGPPAPQAFGGDRRTFGKRGELGPDDRRHDRIGLPGEGRKAAIGAGDDPLSADEIGVMTDALRDEPRVLDKIGCRIDAAR